MFEKFADASALNALLSVAIWLISTAPLYAQAQQQNIAKLKPTHETRSRLFRYLAGARSDG